MGGTGLSRGRGVEGDQDGDGEGEARVARCQGGVWSAVENFNFLDDGIPF